MNQVHLVHPELYRRLQAFSLDRIDAKYPFSQRLAQENDWSVGYAQRVIEEYKKFAFLAVVAEHPVSPSDQVDQVWHLHLLYTRSYWQEFCPEILQQPLHHSPSLGGTQEKAKFDDWYVQTLASYQAFFQALPPADIWPDVAQRFAPVAQPQRWHNRLWRTIALRTIMSTFVAYVVAWALPAMALEGGLGHLNTIAGPDFLGFYGVSMVALGGADMWLTAWYRRSTKWFETPKQNWLTLITIGILYSLGIMRLFIGLNRQRPVDYLLCLVGVVLGYLSWRLYHSQISPKRRFTILAILGMPLAIAIVWAWLGWVILFSILLIIPAIVILSARFYRPSTQRPRRSLSGTPCNSEHCGESVSSVDSGGGSSCGSGCGSGCGGCGGN